ncbi:hypothetical protein B296_00020356 [Ensete ventricosum]|uniref:Uncharacterized protein n=1 Tax=Ensete ventricosum TaxID=4639 RepID=A0A426YFU2_ENSVE|nr:hypothetical protein B296_00020356 [Ensete ventricosum]
MHRVDTIENSPGVLGSSPRVSRVFHDGTREFARRRLRLIGRLSGVTEKLTGSSDEVVGSRRSSLGDSPKGSRSSLGTRREIARRSPKDLPQECRRLLDWPDDECTATAQAFRQLTVADPPVPRCSGG